MVTPERLIAPEIAARYGRALTTVTTKWLQHPAWPEPAGKRGRYKEYDAAEVATAVQVITGQPRVPAGDPDELLDVAAAADELGIGASTIRAYISRGQWPAPDDETYGKRWKRSTIASKRRAYRQRGSVTGREAG